MKKKKFVGTIISIGIGLCIAVLLKTFIVFNAVVPTGSMAPTVSAGDHILGFKSSYWFNEPARGDIIAFYDPEGSNTIFIKRIVGLPNETITIVDGKTYINNSVTALSEPYTNTQYVPTGDFGPYTVPENCYFVMGDNRNNSYDSRHWKTTSFVSSDDIISRISAKYYPEFQTLH